jgi:UDP:flavonoid glycosyltransferase YjiC (YdhE family)
MSSFLIASWDGGGNTPSAFGLGARLARRGHRVRMLGWASMAARAAASGIEFGVYPSVPPWPEGLVHEDGWDLMVECLWGAGCRADVAAEVRAFGADVLVLDCMIRAGFDAARDLAVPTVSLVHVSYQQFLHEWGDDVMQTDVSAMMAGCEAVLALQPPGFDVACEMPAGHEYVGAITDGDVMRTLQPGLAARLAEPGDPWVLLTLSTTTQRGQRETLQTVLDGLATMPVRVLVTLGSTVTASQLDIRANAVVSGFVPHELVLPHMSAVVTHAGMSTVALALAAGVPMVCVPQGRDQGGNAERVAVIGAGVVAPAGEVADAVGMLLTDGCYKAAAERIARACVPLGNGARATDLVEALALAPAMEPIGANPRHIKPAFMPAGGPPE